jgi:hypothetical protein
MVKSNISVSRRKLLSRISAIGTISIAGCAGGGGSQDDIEDSDGDGLIDSEDYAPNDPDVQEKSDVQDTETPTETSTETPTAQSSVQVAKNFLMATATGNTQEAKNLLHPEGPEGEAGEVDSLAEALTEYQVEITDSKIVESEGEDREVVELVFSLEGGQYEGDDLAFLMQKGDSGWLVYEFTDE